MKTFVVLTLVTFITAITTIDQINARRFTVHVSYTGPPEFELGSDPELGCEFDAQAIEGRFTVVWSYNKYTENNWADFTELVEVDSILMQRKYLHPVYESGQDPYAFEIGIQPLISGKATLKIYDWKIKYSREYRCAIKVKGQVVGRKTFHIDTFSKPTRVYLDDYKLSPIWNPRTGKHGMERIEKCTAEHIYPAARFINLVSVNTGRVLNLYGREQARNVHRNEDGTFDDSAIFRFVPNISVHNETYECQVSAYTSATNYTITSMNTTLPIMVEHPTTFARLVISPEDVKEGDQVTISCECDGYPINALEIYHESSGMEYSTLVTSNNNLTQKIQAVKEVTRDMSGSYICLANGEIDEKPFTVNWEGDLVVTKNGEVFTDTNIRLSRGENITLSCEQKSNIQPYLAWDFFRDNNIVFRPDIGLGTEEIVINDATVYDSGTYVCESSVGIKREINVTVEVPCRPQLTIEEYRQHNESFTMNVMCKAIEGNPHCEIEISTDYKLDIAPTIVKTTDSLSWTYEGLSYISNRTKFLCTVSNRINNKVETFTVTKSATNKGYSGLFTGVAVGFGFLFFGVCLLIGLCYIYRQQVAELCRHREGTDTGTRYSDLATALERTLTPSDGARLLSSTSSESILLNES